MIIRFPIEKVKAPLKPEPGFKFGMWQLITPAETDNIVIECCNCKRQVTLTLGGLLKAASRKDPPKCKACEEQKVSK